MDAPRAVGNYPHKKGGLGLGGGSLTMLSGPSNVDNPLARIENRHVALALLTAAAHSLCVCVRACVRARARLTKLGKIIDV